MSDSAGHHVESPQANPDVVDRSGEEIEARIALLSLPNLGPARGTWLLASESATQVIAHLRRGRLPPDIGQAPPGVTARLVERWSNALRSAQPQTLLIDTLRSGADVLSPDHRLWPFAEDPDPPVLLFTRGRLPLLDRGPSVALVGTRQCTTIGREVAHRMGAELAEAGVTVISGLASGIDGAAHTGALAANGAAIAVVGTGLDVVYPGSNRRLWWRMAEEGLLMTEAPLGTKPDRWRFPARNRLIAGLADVTVVVESHERGGSLLTAEESADRGRPVMAVPGAVTSPASIGSNRLLVDGCAPACRSEDVLDVLGLVGTVAPKAARPWQPEAVSGAESLDTIDQTILAEAIAGATHIDALVSLTGLPVSAVLARINRLVAARRLTLSGSTVSVPSPTTDR